MKNICSLIISHVIFLSAITRSCGTVHWDILNSNNGDHGKEGDDVARRTEQAGANRTFKLLQKHLNVLFSALKTPREGKKSKSSKTQIIQSGERDISPTTSHASKSSKCNNTKAPKSTSKSKSTKATKSPKSGNDCQPKADDVTNAPVPIPTKSPTKRPTKSPTVSPSKSPTVSPSKSPVVIPTMMPSPSPTATLQPSTPPSLSRQPSDLPSAKPSVYDCTSPAGRQRDIDLFVGPIAGDPVPGSPEASALDWLTRFDDSNACDGSTAIVERYVLALFYYKLDGPAWNDANGWFLRPDHCDWKGVSCGNGEVEEIQMNSNNLKGQIPAEISNMKGLLSLRMYNNNLEGSIPPSLYELPLISLIDVEDNNLTGKAQCGLFIYWKR